MATSLNCETLLIRTNKKNAPLGIQANDVLKFVGVHGLNGLGVGIMQHLLFLSTRDIKAGELFYDNVFKTVKRADEEMTMEFAKEMKSLQEKNIYFKVEASSDVEMRIGLIPETFLKEFAEKQGNIPVVAIEMETVCSFGKVGNSEIICAKSPHNNASNSDMSIYFDIPKVKGLFVNIISTF